MKSGVDGCKKETKTYDAEGILPLQPFVYQTNASVREITAGPSIARKLTAEDVKLLSRCGIGLSFVRYIST